MWPRVCAIDLVLIDILFLLFLLGPALGFHFYKNVGERTCFRKELTRGSILAGKFKLEIRDPENNQYRVARDRNIIGILVDVEESFDRGHRVVHQRVPLTGQFLFSALGTGEHIVCVTPKSFYTKSWFGSSQYHPQVLRDTTFKQAKIGLDLSIEDSSFFGRDHTHNIRELTARINQLNNKLSDIRREQLFLKGKEASFRDQSERVCEKVMRWLLVQLALLCILCIYQIVSLNRLSKKPKTD